MNLLEKYRLYIKKNHFTSDAMQIQAIFCLQEITDQLVQSPAKKNHSWFSKIINDKPNYIKGLYLWGGVGRGKTFIMDLFFDELDIHEKKRIHFNHFMKMIHKMLHRYKGHKKPLDLIASHLANDIKLLCFDEFFVEDIADAMILGNFFQKIFDKGITLVATSNVKLDLLYAGGLQRDSFLPAIQALKDHTQELNVDSGIDYRWQILKRQKRYYYPLKNESSFMNKMFDACDCNQLIEGGDLLLDGRRVSLIKRTTKTIWFEFDAICGFGRGVLDYIEIASMFLSVLISNIPILTNEKEDEARRLVSLVDEFYDTKIALILSAEVDMQELYQGTRLRFEFQRVSSRLREMQSDEFLEQVKKEHENG